MKSHIPLSTQQATAAVFWTAFESLPPSTRESFLERLLENREFRCDLMDLAIMEKRGHEKTRPFPEYLKERHAKAQCKRIKS
ncbi:MAG: hypothetical protein KKH28_07720 [Elusimicrobia bacterium]|nr:hypothetical protein [Elusimicrobiota bacterium]